jgi:hypothetical protein
VRGSRALVPLCFAILFAAAPLRAAFRAAWPFDGHLAAIDSTVPGRSTEDDLKSGGADVALNFSPILGWDESRWLILPSLDVDSNSANTILKVDDQRFEFLSQSDTRVELGGAFKRTPDQRFGARLFGESFQAKQAANETLATGQYDYQDKGVEADWREKWDTGIPFRSTLGLSSTDRQYPNWMSLDPSQLHEKDQTITRLYTDLEWAWSAHHGRTIVGLSLQSEDYKEALVVDETGTTANAVRQKDSITQLDIDVPFTVGKHSFTPGLTGIAWESNLTNYDADNNYFTPNYNQFGEVDGRLGYAYDFDGPWAWGFFDSPQLTLDLDLELRQYVGRLAKNADGSLSGEAERDFTRNFSIGFNSPCSDHWAFFAKFNHLDSASNNQEESSALYNYIFNTFSLGANFSY